jgi:integrase/recombinase XerD
MRLNEESLNRWLSRVLSRLSAGRRTKLEEYVRYMRTSGFSPWTIKANIQAVLTLGLNGKPYEELTREDLLSWMESLPSSLRPESIRSYRKRVKAFLRWVHGIKPGEPSPEHLRVIREGREQGELPKEILSQEEVQRLIAACDSLRNRALVHALYESGGRASEILNLRVGDVEFDRLGAVIIVKGKTGMRRIRLIESVPDLQRWLAVHPGRGNPDAPLWPGKGGPLTVERLNDMLKTAARKAGINKRVHPHLLRHTRATHLAKILTEDQMRVYFGWSRTSHVPARYVHLSGRDVDDTLTKHYEVARRETGRVCPRCGFRNPEGGIYCSRCSAVLSEAEAFRVEERAMREEEIVIRLVKKLIELAPDALERALAESRALEQLASVSEGHRTGAGEGI